MSEENRIEWTKLLEQAISEPGKINQAYRHFHGYNPRGVLCKRGRTDGGPRSRAAILLAVTGRFRGSAEP
jgi:hypothetical protein